MNYPFSNIDEILGDLPKVHEGVIRWRYGIGLKRMMAPSERESRDRFTNLGDNSHTLEEIAKYLGYRGKQRTHQLHNQALDKLRHPSRLSSLVALFENDMYSPQILTLAQAVLGSEDFGKLKMASPDFSELEPVRDTRITVKFQLPKKPFKPA